MTKAEFDRELLVAVNKLAQVCRSHAELCGGSPAALRDFDYEFRHLLDELYQVCQSGAELRERDQQFLYAVHDALWAHQAGRISSDETCSRLLAWHVAHHNRVEDAGGCGTPCA